MQTHAARAGLPGWARGVLAQPGELLPALAAIHAAEQRRVLDTGIDQIRIGQRRLEVPDPFELPWMWRPVVPLVRAWHAVVRDLLAGGLPRLAAVVRSLERERTILWRLGDLPHERIAS